jgi:GT2 family glycosyltransferase/MoaA/NifB/PqqE/SkfB family radical SAM enzyme
MELLGRLPFAAANTPRTLWIELTSKCPFDCVFCSRKERRGSGEHLPFHLYRRLIGELQDPRTLLLNYSGESTVYPDLIPAIQLARSSGAFVELVSAFAAIPESMLKPLSESGLNRLTVSLHATDTARYSEIYRYGSFQALRARLSRFLELSGALPQPPIVDLAFVAMDRNLAELPSVAEFAESLGLRSVMIFPVLRRDEIPVTFPVELNGNGTHRPEFEARLKAMVEVVQGARPEIQLTISNSAFTGGEVRLGEVPVPCPGMLPAGGRIHSCDQNPWETVHVLANGDLVACEVLDRISLGNLHEQTLAEIWHGERYRQFREQYYRGEIAGCRSCPWKRAYRPGPMASEILGARGRSAQLLHGWHEPDESHIWSSRQATALIAPRADSRSLHINGVLPPGQSGDPNELVVRCNGKEIGRVRNTTCDMMPFGVNLAVDEAGSEPWLLEFRTRHLYRPSEQGTGTDQRDLGFALSVLASKRSVNAANARQTGSLQRLARAIGWIDRVGGRREKRGEPPAPPYVEGVSVVIPERQNPEELAECLRSLQEAAANLDEPVEIIVVVNGSAAAQYDALRQSYISIHWRFHERPLGFGRAVRAGLAKARYDWVYLLNNDVALDADALAALAPLRDDRTFSISSQVFLKDRTRFRDETNWGVLLIEDGLATIHDWLPRSGDPVESFYSGGGASLFQKRLLWWFLEPAVYDPFYWEDVEWGWRARKMGYRSMVCPASIAHHRRQATIGRFYSSGEIEDVLLRNRLLFQLRNFTAVGSLERVMEEIGRAPEPVAQFFRKPGTLGLIAKGRIWNHRARLSDEEVFAEWRRAVAIPELALTAPANWAS